MAAFNKFNQFVEDFGLAIVNLDTDNLFILLSNTSPNAADIHVDTVLTPCVVESTSNAAEIAAGSGYTKKGAQVTTNVYSETSGTAKLTGDAVTFTASGGSIGPFRYAVLYDDSAVTADARPVIGWWDLGSAITLNDGQSLKIGKDTSGNNWDSTTPILSVT